MIPTFNGASSAYLIGYFNLADVRIAKGKLCLFVASGWVSKFTFVTGAAARCRRSAVKSGQSVSGSLCRAAGMFVVESYAAVRQFVFVEGHSCREAAEVFGLNRDTVRQMCLYTAAYQMVRRRASRRRPDNYALRTPRITAYPKNGSMLKRAAAMANHALTRTTQLRPAIGRRDAGRRRTGHDLAYLDIDT